MATCYKLLHATCSAVVHTSLNKATGVLWDVDRWKFIIPLSNLLLKMNQFSQNSLLLCNLL